MDVDKELLTGGLGGGNDQVVEETIVVRVVRSDTGRPELPVDGEGVKEVVEDLSTFGELNTGGSSFEGVGEGNLGFEDGSSASPNNGKDEEAFVDELNVIFES